MSSAQRQIIVLPNIRVEGRMELGHFNLASSSDAEIVPKIYRKHLAMFSKLYRTVNGDVDDVGILVRAQGRNRLGPLSDNERRQVENIVDVLVFSSCYGYRSLGLARDNFSYTIWNFDGSKPPTEFLSLGSRRGLNIVEYRPHLLQVPYHIHRSTCRDESFDQKLLQSLLFSIQRDTNDTKRILRAIHWFNLAHADTEEVTEYTRFAMIATAFESLLDTPRQGVTAYFVNTLQLLLGQSDKLAEWGADFYNKRSSIIHGRELPGLMFGKHQHNSLLALADIVFLQCTYRQIGLLGFWLDPIDERVRRKNVVHYLISNKERFEAIVSFELSRRSVNRAEVVRDYLHTIQSQDASVDAADCDQVFSKILDLALSGLTSLSRMIEMRTPSRRSLIAGYRSAFRNMERAVENNTDVNVFQVRQDMAKQEAEPWDDAYVRGTPFGHAKVISLDALLAAMDQVADLRTELRYKS